MTEDRCSCRRHLAAYFGVSAAGTAAATSGYSGKIASRSATGSLDVARDDECSDGRVQRSRLQFGVNANERTPGRSGRAEMAHKTIFRSNLDVPDAPTRSIHQHRTDGGGKRMSTGQFFKAVVGDKVVRRVSGQFALWARVDHP